MNPRAVLFQSGDAQAGTRHGDRGDQVAWIAMAGVKAQCHKNNS